LILVKVIIIKIWFKISRLGLFGDVGAFYVKSIVVSSMCTVHCAEWVSLCTVYRTHTTKDLT